MQGDVSQKRADDSTEAEFPLRFQRSLPFPCILLLTIGVSTSWQGNFLWFSSGVHEQCCQNTPLYRHPAPTSFFYSDKRPCIFSRPHRGRFCQDGIHSLCLQIWLTRRVPMRFLQSPVGICLLCWGFLGGASYHWALEYSPVLPEVVSKV